MAWHIFPSHHVAHIQPTLTDGTEATGYPIGNVRTLAVNIRAKITCDGTNGINIDWDRGTTNGAALNSIIIVGNNMDTGTWTVTSDTVSNFASPTTLINASTTFAEDVYEAFASATTERYIRFHYEKLSGEYQFGLISFGLSYQVATTGPQIRTEENRADSVDVQRRRFSFRKVTRANANSIVAAASRHYIYDSTTAVRDGIGGAGSLNPIAVCDDSGPTVYYGRASVSGRPFAANYTEVFVDMDQIRNGVFA